MTRPLKSGWYKRIRNKSPKNSIGVKTDPLYYSRSPVLCRSLSTAIRISEGFSSTAGCRTTNTMSDPFLREESFCLIVSVIIRRNLFLAVAFCTFFLLITTPILTISALVKSTCKIRLFSFVLLPFWKIVLNSMDLVIRLGLGNIQKHNTKATRLVALFVFSFFARSLFFRTLFLFAQETRAFCVASFFWGYTLCS